MRFLILLMVAFYWPLEPVQGVGRSCSKALQGPPSGYLGLTVDCNQVTGSATVGWKENLPQEVGYITVDYICTNDMQPTVVTYNTDPGVGSVTANGLPLNKTGLVCVFTGCFTLNNLGSTLYADSRKVPCSAVVMPSPTSPPLVICPPCGKNRVCNPPNGCTCVSGVRGKDCNIRDYLPDQFQPISAGSFFCEMNDDEFGRPYLGPYDQFTPAYHSIFATYSNFNVSVNQSTTMPRTQRSTLQFPECLFSKECDEHKEKCFGNGTIYDGCGRRCSCVNGYTQDCCRVRKEWNSMTQEEKCRYVDAVRNVSTTPPYKACYDQLIELYNTTGIHGTQNSFFLPWHRWYILGFENLLRNIDCRITVPYWDWSLSPNSWQNSSVWDATCGFGGDGSDNSSCVTTGPFAYPSWNVTRSAGSGCLKRAFSGSVPDCATVAFLQQTKLESSNSWRLALEVTLSNNVHCRIGQTMCSRDSPNDPIFFLHHAFIDKLWSDWQNRGIEYKYHLVGAQNKSEMPSSFGNKTSDVLDLLNQTGCVKVCMEPSHTPCEIQTTYTPICPASITSVSKLAKLIHKPIPAVPETAFKLFGNTDEERFASRRLYDILSSSTRLEVVMQQSDIKMHACNSCNMGVSLNKFVFED